jgi:hypothetical protein
MNSTPIAVIRLSARDVRFILSGLAWLAFNHQQWAEKRKLPNARPDRSWAPGLDRGAYDQKFMDSLLALHARAEALQAGRRLRVCTSFELSACALSVRVAMTRHRHGHSRLDLPRIDSSSARLLRRLESARKRAKRAEIRRSGKAAYAANALSWRKFVQWLRIHFLDCKCKRSRRYQLPRARRIQVRQFMEWARAELIDRRERVPRPIELRRLVRLALRYVRRGRTGFGIRELHNDKIRASAYFANFVTIRMEKAKRRES